MVILIFIFLTPSKWFTGGERARAGMHPRPIVTVLLSPEVVTNETDKGQIQEIVKGMTDRTEVEVVEVRKVTGTNGKTLSFEVDIR